MTRLATALGCGVLAMVLAAPAADAQPPYETKVTGDVVRVRAGPGEWWYVTGQLKRGDTVTVVGSQFGWAEIKPPAGQFSLIRAADVDVTDSVGYVKDAGQAAVRAGPSGEKRFNRIQCYLPPKTQVAVHRSLGDYYMIAPPEGATVFVSAELLAGAAGAGDAPIARPVEPPVRPVTPPPVEPVAAPPATQPVAAPVQPAQPTTSLKAVVEAHQKMVQDEQAKPLADRDYAGLKTRFEKLKIKGEAEKNAALVQYADAVILYLTQQMEVQRLAKAVPADISGILQPVEPTASTGPAAVEKFRAVGVLRKSEMLGESRTLPNLHKLESADGQKVVCYVLPADASADWSAWEGRPVQVTGKREYRVDWKINIVHAERIEPAGDTGGPTAPVVAPTPPVAPPQPDPSLLQPRFIEELPAPPATQPTG